MDFLQHLRDYLRPETVKCTNDLENHLEATYTDHNTDKWKTSTKLTFLRRGIEYLLLSNCLLQSSW